jgi:hypothetical protein
MRRVLVGGIAAGLAGASLMAWSLPASAQEGEEPPMLAATLEPATVATGGTVTVSSVDPCPGGDVALLAMGPEGWIYEPEPEPEALSVVPLAEDGSWTSDEVIPFAAGAYEVVGLCVDDVAAGEIEDSPEALADIEALGDGGEEEPPADDPIYGFYGPLALTVTGMPGTVPPGTPPPAPGPGTPPGPAPAPGAPVAQPVTAQPDYTG